MSPDLRRRVVELTADRPQAAVRAAVADLATDRPGASLVGPAESSSGPKALPGREKVARSGRGR